MLDAREHQVALARELGGRRLEVGLAHLSAGEGGGQCESEGLQVEWWVGGGWGWGEGEGWAKGHGEAKAEAPVRVRARAGARTRRPP